MKKIIATNKAPSAIGPYSQAIHTSANEMLFVSGQIGFDPSTMLLKSNDISGQTKQALENLEAIITSAGFSKEQIVKTTIFLKDMNDFAQMNEIYSTFLQGAFPARSTVEVARLPKDALFEIEAVLAR